MPLQEELAELLCRPEAGAEAPSLATMEERLTDGYAHALELEAERLRIERRLGEIARAAGSRQIARERVELSDRLSNADGELARLRPLLRSLQQRARALRRARR